MGAPPRGRPEGHSAQQSIGRVTAEAEKINSANAGQSDSQTDGQVYWPVKLRAPLAHEQFEEQLDQEREAHGKHVPPPCRVASHDDCVECESNASGG